ncbi:MAG: hypothetical protein WAO83_20075 [Fuerstiella sp.]
MNPITITGGLLGILMITGGAFTYMSSDNTEHVHYGTVFSCTNSKLIMTDEDGTKSTHLVTSTTEVTWDGEVCQARDLMSGVRIRVTTEGAREGAAIAIDGLAKYVATPD